MLLCSVHVCTFATVCNTLQPKLSPLAQAELNAAEGIMEELTDARNTFVHWFLEPVEPGKWGLVDYSATIRRPMDISTGTTAMP